MKLGTDGLRGELTLMRAARALAALRRRSAASCAVGDAHLRRVAPPALRHRLRRNPLDDAGSTVRVDRAVAELFPCSTAARPWSSATASRSGMRAAGWWRWTKASATTRSCRRACRSAGMLLDLQSVTPAEAFEDQAQIPDLGRRRPARACCRSGHDADPVLAGPDVRGRRQALGASSAALALLARAARRAHPRRPGRPRGAPMPTTCRRGGPAGAAAAGDARLVEPAEPPPASRRPKAASEEPPEPPEPTSRPTPTARTDCPRAARRPRAAGGAGLAAARAAGQPGRPGRCAPTVRAATAAREGAMTARAASAGAAVRRAPRRRRAAASA
jgi:hypothetical protein